MTDNRNSRKERKIGKCDTESDSEDIAKLRLVSA